MYSAISVESIVVIVVAAIASKYVADRYIIVLAEAIVGTGLILLLIMFNYTSPLCILQSYIQQGAFDKADMCFIIIGVLVLGLPSQNTAVMSVYSKLIDQEFGAQKQGLYSGVMVSPSRADYSLFNLLGRWRLVLLHVF